MALKPVMNSLYWIFAILFIFRVQCNPATELSDTEPTVPTAEESTTETIKELSEEILIDTTIASEVITSTEESLPESDCSHCLNHKYLNHYYAKGCKPIFDERCKDCPKKFDCSLKEEVIVGRDECLYNGIKYKVSESVAVDNPCKVCQCGYGFTNTYGLSYSPFTTIHCITVECPENFGVHPFPLAGFENDFEKSRNCYNIYARNQCCAVDKKCLDSETEINEKFCEYNEKKYRIGEKIYPNEDKCKVCICDENWDTNSTINNSGCFEVKCNLEVQLKDGCLPIYHENTCCPVDSYCPEIELDPDVAKCSEIADSGPCMGEFKRFYFNLRDGRCHSFVYSGCGGNDNNFRSHEECQQTCAKYNPNQDDSDDKQLESNTTESGNYCLFKEKRFEVGAKIDIGNNCIDCECRVPPDFTCIQKKCPILPLDDCKITFNPSQCCPIIDCNYNKSNDITFNRLNCPTPMCMKGCLFEEYPDKCPNCVCQPSNEDDGPSYNISDV